MGIGQAEADAPVVSDDDLAAELLGGVEPAAPAAPAAAPAAPAAPSSGSDDSNGSGSGGGGFTPGSFG